MTTRTTTGAFFERKYQADLDPWNFESSTYEQARYQSTIAALANRRYRRAFEPGCSIGVLTDQLATVCDHLLALDISPTAAQRARLRCAHLPNVEICCGSLPEHLTDGPFDLIVLSEIGYYFEATSLRLLAGQLVQTLEPGGVLLGVHWLGVSADHVLGGEQVHAILEEQPGIEKTLSERHEAFRLDRWLRL